MKTLRYSSYIFCVPNLYKNNLTPRFNSKFSISQIKHKLLAGCVKKTINTDKHL